MFHLLVSRVQNHKLPLSVDNFPQISIPFVSSVLFPKRSTTHIRHTSEQKTERTFSFGSVSIYFLIIDILLKVSFFCIHKYFNGNFHNDINLFLKCVFVSRKALRLLRCVQCGFVFHQEKGWMRVKISNEDDTIQSRGILRDSESSSFFDSHISPSQTKGQLNKHFLFPADTNKTREGEHIKNAGKKNIFLSPPEGKNLDFSINDPHLIYKIEIHMGRIILCLPSQAIFSSRFAFFSSFSLTPALNGWRTTIKQFEKIVLILAHSGCTSVMC